MKKILLLPLFLLSLAGAGPAQAETYVLDPAHSSVVFCAKHLVISTVCGRFKEFEATINLDETDITKSSWSGTIKTASITTEQEKRDAHLKSPDFFDAEKYPEITFKSSKIEKQGEGYVSHGTFTMRGVSKEITIPFTLNGPVSVFGTKKIGISSEMKINRQDYGVSWNKNIDSGGVVVSDEITIKLDAEANVKK